MNIPDGRLWRCCDAVAVFVLRMICMIIMLVAMTVVAVVKKICSVTTDRNDNAT